MRFRKTPLLAVRPLDPYRVGYSASAATSVLFSLALAAGSHGATQTWISGRVAWDTTSPNWDAGVPWVNGNDAIFNAGTGIVMIGAGGVQAASLQINATATIEGATLTLTGGANINAAGGTVGTIQSSLAGSSGLTVGAASSGNVILFGANTYTGVTRVTNGAWLGAETSTALGDAGQGTVVEAGSTLSLGTVTIASEALSIAGAGTAASDGALHVNGVITQAHYNGPITATADATIGSEGTLTLGGTVDKADVTLTVNAINSITFNGAITGNTAGFNDDMIFTGGGTVTLGAANTYLGPTSIINGTTVNANVPNALPTMNGRTSVAMDGTGTGSSTLGLGANQSIASLAGAASSRVMLGGNTLTVGFGSGLNANGTADANFQGVISGTGGVVKDDDSTQTFSGANSYDGVTRVEDGVLRASSATALGGFADGTVVSDGASLVVNGVTITNEALSIAGGGFAGIGGALSDGGSTASYNGQIILVADATIGSQAGGMFSLGGPIDKSDLTLTVNAAGTVNVNGAITGNTVGFDDDMIFTGGGTVNLNAANTYLGPTSIINGTTVNANVANALPTANGRTTITMDGTGSGGSTLDISGANQAVASLTGAASSQVVLGGNVLTIGFGTAPNTNGDASANFAGVISGAGGLTKDDTSTQILSGANSFTGITNVLGGTLVAASDSALGSSAVPGSVTNVQGGATLAVQGGVTIAERVTLFNNANLINNAGTNTLTNVLLVEHDLNGTNPGQKLAHIGVIGGRLNLTGGIEDHAAQFSNNPEMNLALNTGANENGTLHIDSVIDTSIRDITIGRAGNTTNNLGVVILGGNNQHSGDTFLNGGPVMLGEDGNNSQAFGDSQVIVNNTNFLIGAASPSPGAQLQNAFELNAGSTLNTQGNLGIGGTINGGGNLTVTTGTLSLFGTGTNTYSGATTVDAGATLATTGPDKIGDNSDLAVHGTVTLGGNEGVRNLTGSATGLVVTNGNILTVNQTADGTFGGDITGAGGLTKEGAANLTLDGPQSFTGPANVVAGTLTINGTLASNTVNISNGATMTTAAANLLSDSATVRVDGTLNLGGNDTIANLLGAATGVVNLGANNLLLTGGIDFQGRLNGAGGSVSVGPGDLILGGSNTFTGLLRVMADSTTTLDGSVDGDVQIDAGGTLLLGSSERIKDSATITILTAGGGNSNGVLSLNGTETVTTLNSGGTIRGNGQLNADTYNLTDGAITQAGANLGDGILNSNGSVLLGGDAFANTVNVQTGTMRLNGSLINAFGLEVNVSGGATLALGVDERIGNNAVANVNGTLTLTGTETITTFNLDGPGSALNGTGLLVANTYNLSNGATTVAGANMGGGVLNSGPGTVTLGGNSAAEDVNIDSGTFNLNGQLTAVTDLTIASGATVNLGGPERVNDAAVVNVHQNGTLNLNGIETVRTFNSGGTLGLAPGAIAGTLITTGNTINLMDGHVSLNGTNLQNLAGPNPQLTSNGTVTINGTANDVTVGPNNATINVGTADIQSGTLNLNGLFINPSGTIDIRSGATLVSGSANRINGDAATVNVANGGTWTLGGDDTIGILNSSGLLNGAGVLTATTYNLSNGAVTAAGADLGGGTLNSGPGPVTLNGNAAAETANLLSGTLNLNGQLTAVTSLNIANGATLVSGSANRVNDGATASIVTGGTWTLAGDDTIALLNSGGLLNGNGTLTAATYNLTDGAVTDTMAHLGAGTLNSDGIVTLNGNAAAGIANVNTGTLNLNGQLTAVTNLTIANGAAVNLGSAERINNAAVVNNFGELDLSGNETVMTYNADGGALDAAGLLTASTYNLSNGASTAAGADLGTGALNSGPGTVTLNGNTNATTIDIDSGNLVTNGAVQNAAGVITVDAGATWNANGSYTYATLQGHGTVDPGGANGSVFRNENTISPGPGLGTLTIAGDHVESGIYHADLDASPASDTIGVTGSTTLANDSRLRLAEFGALVGNSGAVLCGERWNIIDTPDVINGGWSEISDGNNPGGLGQTFQSLVLFDRGSGDVVSLGLTAGQSVADYAGINGDQVALLDAILGGATGSDLVVGNYNSRDGGAGTLLDAVFTAGAPGDKNALLNALNGLSPERYAGALDYALHVTRGYAQDVMRVSPHRAAAYGMVQGFDEPGSDKGADKGGFTQPVSPRDVNYEVFGGFHHLSVGSDSSRSGQDYDLRSYGGYLGGRIRANPNLLIGGFLAVDGGSVEGGGLELDASGVVLGAYVDYTPQGPDGPLGLWASAGYGFFEFDGHRRGLLGRYSVPEFDASAFQVAIGGGYDVYRRNGLRVTPGAGLRYVNAETDGFTERGGAGALAVRDQDDEAVLLDIGVHVFYQQPGQPFAFEGGIGWQHDFADSSRDVEATFAAAGPAFEVTSPGLGEDAFVFTLGSHYDISERYRIGLAYRGELRSEADPFHGIDLRFTAGF